MSKASLGVRYNKLNTQLKLKLILRPTLAQTLSPVGMYARNRFGAQIARQHRQHIG